MYYKVKLEDHIRVPPPLFGLEIKDAIAKQISEKYGGMISKELGIVIDVIGVDSVADGTIIPGDGASYYQSIFDLLVFRIDLHEIFMGKVKDVADFGAFMNIGPVDGMIHISQTMDDYVSFSKDKVLLGKESKRSLKPNDLCRARIIATSFKDVTNPKIGLTMRQIGLGKLEWIEEDNNPKSKKKAK